MFSETADSYLCLDWIKSKEFTEPSKNLSEASSKAFFNDSRVLFEASYNLIAPFKSLYAWLIEFSRFNFYCSYWFLIL